MRKDIISKTGGILVILMALTVTGCKNESMNWSMTYGLGYFNCVEQTSDGGYVAGGWHGIMKFDACGNLLWQKPLGVWNPVTKSSCVIIHQTQDNGYIALERIESSMPTGVSFWFADVLIKLNTIGVEEWRKVIRNSDWEIMPVTSVQQTSDNGYILSGGDADPEGGPIGVLIKTDSLGINQWTQEFEGFVFSAWENPTGGYSLIGLIPIDSNNYETMIVKTDEDGIEVWRKTYEDTLAWSEFVTEDGGAVLAVEDSDTANAAILKIDADGNVVWKQTYAHTGKTDGMGFILSVEQTSDHGYMIAGNRSEGGWSDSGAWIVRTDQDGNETSRWSSDFGVEVLSVEQVRPTLDGGYILAGYILPDETGVNQAWLAKTDANGNTSD